MAGIKREIKFDYPTPIATAYGRACSSEERAERAKRFRELFEISIRYAALSGCARVFASGSTDSRLDTLKVLGQEKLSLGHWVSIVGALERVLAERGEHVLGTALREQRKNLPHCIALLKSFDGFDAEKISLATVFDRLTKLRNMEAHRVGFDLASDVELYRAALEELLEKTAVWRRWQLLLVLGTEHRRSGTSARCHAFRGDTTHELVTIDIDENRTLYSHTLYLHDPDSKSWVELSPFLLHKNGKIYFFDGIDRRRRPKYSLESEQLDHRTIEEAEQHLRERAGFLFAQEPAEPSLDTLAPFVQMAAADGVITAPELRFLRGRVEQVVVGKSDEEIGRIVADAIARFAPLIDELVDPATTPWNSAGERVARIRSNVGR